MRVQVFFSFLEGIFMEPKYRLVGGWYLSKRYTKSANPSTD